MKNAVIQPQTEKPPHYTYLKEFRVNQCPLFLQHKCTQHRPFTCFNWHFANQRRRRPVRKRDGSFNYSSDVYCSKYDETTGICPNSDDCPCLHRNTGDTERRYHLRYYKTGTCIHETDSRGNCVKNGPHCAFAHGAQDLRPPVYDVKDTEKSDPGQRNDPVEQFNLAEKIINDDPKWHDGNYVLANYKTEPCRRPPRLCRQGYACPQFHNLKDRRRNPKKFKYRSSPCPIVKQGDDWKDPSSCDKGDNCQFCHTRTEQQFHPEIYKSTKCHDMLQNGYCPRGPFCAFAHVHTEIRVLEDADLNSLPRGAQVMSPLSTNSNTSHQDIIDQQRILSRSAPGTGRPSVPTELHFAAALNQEMVRTPTWNVNSPMGGNIPSPTPPLNEDLPHSGLFRSPIAENADSFQISSNNIFPSCPSPISKPQTWTPSSLGKSETRLPFSGRADVQSHSVGGFGFSGSPFSWGGAGSQVGSNLFGRSGDDSSPKANSRLQSFNLSAKHFYPPDETVDSVVGNALDDFHERPGSGSNRLWPEPIGTGRSDSNSLFAMSAPVNIPQEFGMRGLNRNQMPTPSPPGAIGHPLFYGSLDATGTRGSHAGSLPSIGRPPSSSGLSSKEGYTGSASLNENNMLVELDRMQKKCKQWEVSWNQAKAACDAWKREATEANERAKVAREADKKVVERNAMLESELQKANKEIASLVTDIQSQTDVPAQSDKCLFLHRAQKGAVLKQMSVKDLRELREKLRSDLDSVDKVLWESYGIQCEEGWVSK